MASFDALTFPAGFLWGTATASHQYEGGNTNNQWYAWEQAGRTRGLSGSACEWWNGRWREDLDLKVNCFWLQHYGYDESDPTKQYWRQSQSVWFDDVVVARQYIGPRMPEKR